MNTLLKDWQSNVIVAVNMEATKWKLSECDQEMSPNLKRKQNIVHSESVK